jgi:hypothetical protein
VLCGGGGGGWGRVIGLVCVCVSVYRL